MYIFGAVLFPMCWVSAFLKVFFVWLAVMSPGVCFAWSNPLRCRLPANSCCGHGCYAGAYHHRQEGLHYLSAGLFSEHTAWSFCRCNFVLLGHGIWLSAAAARWRAVFFGLLGCFFQLFGLQETVLSVCLTASYLQEFGLVWLQRLASLLADVLAICEQCG